MMGVAGGGGEASMESDVLALTLPVTLGCVRMRRGALWEGGVR